MTNEKAVAARCPVCACPVDEGCIPCPRCQTPHHADCWEYAGGCAIFGCAEGRARAVVPATGKWTRLQWLTTIWFGLFTLHWFTFAMVGLGLTSMAVSACTGLILSDVLATGAIAGALNLALTVVMAIANIFLFIGLPSYLLLFPPAWLLQKFVERAAGQRLAVPSSARTKDVLERLDPPLVGRAIAGAYRVLTKTATVLLVTGGVLVLSYVLIPHYPPHTSGANDAVAGLAGLAVARLLLLPLFSWATRLRVTYLASLQNRLLASFKGKEPPTSSGA